MNEPVRILHLVTAMNRGGLETMIMNYYREIDRSKVQFDFLVHSPEPGAFDEEIRALGGRIFTVPRLKIQNIIRYWVALNKFLSEHKEYKILHSHLNAMSGIPLVVAKGKRVPVRIAHSHSTRIQNARRATLLNKLKKITPLVATDLLACSADAGRFMFGESDFAVVRNAIDPDKFKFNVETREDVRAELGIQKGDVLIGNVGNLRALKNHIFLLKIFKDLVKELPEARLAIVGKDAGELDRLQEFVMENNLECKVIFTGARPDVHRILQALDVFVMPSIYEGLPVVSIEAQATGLPCLFSSTVTNELALSSECDFLGLEDPIEKWTNAIIEKSEGRLKIQERINASELLESGGYDVQVEAPKLQSFYLQSLGNVLQDR